MPYMVLPLVIPYMALPLVIPYMALPLVIPYMDCTGPTAQGEQAGWLAFPAGWVAYNPCTQ